jgi:hypothetical protein
MPFKITNMLYAFIFLITAIFIIHKSVEDDGPTDNY